MCRTFFKILYMCEIIIRMGVILKINAKFQFSFFARSQINASGLHSYPPIGMQNRQIQMQITPNLEH